MGYYQGDYRGDFYKGVRGDPGFFSFIGGLAQKAASFLPGPAAGVAQGVLSKISTGTLATRGMSIAKGAGALIKQHPVLSGAAAAGALAGVGEAGKMVRGRAGRMRMHAGLRRHRRMRVTNPKALRRAIRRTQGFAKLAMRTIHLVHPKRKVRFGGFRKARKKAA